jgi:hypothetical protein
MNGPQAGNREEHLAAKELARSLIATHGDGALAVAEQALANVRSLTMQTRIIQWLMIIEALKAAQADNQP